ncbi:indolepyruvate oxidoreductase subunit beta [Candidatus Fermentibacteria bacterium]|nr:indolepyruvate oxidoreductase subunit beta [Candidatus Fermentibacteria bacterium]
MELTNVFICGTGGQGILLASEVVSAAAQSAGLDVKKSEVHGMAQRGGSVTSHVRFGSKVYSPLIELGRSDLVLSMEKLEALRWLPYLAPGGRMLMSDIRINPLTVNVGDAEYPDVEAALNARDVPYDVIPAYEIARGLGNVRVVNTVMLGAASVILPLGPEYWKEAVEQRVPPKALKVNMEAFEKGRSLLG